MSRYIDILYTTPHSKYAFYIGFCLWSNVLDKLARPVSPFSVRAYIEDTQYGLEYYRHINCHGAHINYTYSHIYIYL